MMVLISINRPSCPIRGPGNNILAEVLPGVACDIGSTAHEPSPGCIIHQWILLLVRGEFGECHFQL